MWGAWGKASGARPPHPLVCHIVDTTAVAERLMPTLLGPVCLTALRGAFSVLDDPDGWIALLCGLHDLGKYTPGFQALRADLATERLDVIVAADVRYLERPKGVPRVDTPHGTVTALHVREMLTRWGMGFPCASMIAAALGGHHGYFPAADQIAQANNEVNDHGGRRWAAWRDGMALDVAAALGLAEPGSLPWAEVRLGVEAAVGLAALASVSDWIASDTSNYTSPQGAFDLVGYVAQARANAREALDKARLQPWKPPPETSFEALFPQLDTVRPVQRTVESLVADRTSPTMLVVEAPTGEGKTNLALQAAATLVGNLGLSGTYVGMPTKATSHQFLGEVERLLGRLGDSTAVKLVHSDAKAFLEERAVEPSDIGRDDANDSDVAAREWFTHKKSLLASFGVGTLDQALKAVVRSGHLFVRLTALSNKVVVFDEVHAYDTQMSALLDRLLMWLGCLGGSVVMLSATLPSSRRRELVVAWQAGVLGCPPSRVPAEEGVAVYPRVTVAGRGSARVLEVGVSELNSHRRVVLDKGVTDDEVVDWLIDHAGSGRAVAAVHNMRSRAKATYQAVCDAVEQLAPAARPKIVLLHGEMSNAQRRRIETRLRCWFGREGKRPHAIVVGTQVLEQSLDLDFDAMLTDLAPVDLLIQRAGRVHRHRRDGRGELVLGITGVTDTPAGPKFPRYLHGVYSTHVLTRTWVVLRDRSVIVCPDDVSGLVDAVYGPADAVDCPAGWETSWRASQESYRKDVDAQREQARQWYVPMPMAIEQLNEMTDIPKHPRNLRAGGKRRDRAT
ncbi:CRISPR-associated helicase Cas3' [Saccharothrix xinjiangensis]|uniref:CRISPR-associated helicase Cas3 n=1 Tax=Saccharothrix xinjiangensis TaxID=204798 RepID=A0ABV9YBY3_9PSEU